MSDQRLLKYILEQENGFIHEAASQPFINFCTEHRRLVRVDRAENELQDSFIISTENQHTVWDFGNEYHVTYNGKCTKS